MSPKPYTPCHLNPTPAPPPPPPPPRPLTQAIKGALRSAPFSGPLQSLQSGPPAQQQQHLQVRQLRSLSQQHMCVLGGTGTGRAQGQDGSLRPQSSVASSGTGGSGGSGAAAAAGGGGLARG